MRWRTVVLAVLLAFGLGVEPLSVVARAEDGSAEAESFNRDKFWDYAMCGASVVFASTTGAWVLAFITCGRAVTLHWAD
jgi:hypothetical protein